MMPILSTFSVRSPPTTPNRVALFVVEAAHSLRRPRDTGSPIFFRPQPEDHHNHKIGRINAHNQAKRANNEPMRRGLRRTLSPDPTRAVRVDAWREASGAGLRAPKGPQVSKTQPEM